MVLRLVVIFALFVSTSVFAKTRTGAVSAKVTDFAVGLIAPKFNACVLTVDSENGKRLGLVIDVPTCKKNEDYYKQLIGKDVEFKRASYRLIKDADLLANLQEYNSEVFYVKLQTGAKVSVPKPAVAKVEKISESLAISAFGEKPVCVVYLSFASDNDKIGVLLDSFRCKHEGYASLVGKNIQVLNSDLQYLNSKSQIGALQAIDKAYFYKAYADSAPSLATLVK